MDDETLPQRRFPASCRVCGEVKGYPMVVHTVRTRPRVIRIDIVCHECKAEWSIEVEIKDA